MGFILGLTSAARRKPTIGAVSSRLLSDPALLNIAQPSHPNPSLLSSALALSSLTLCCLLMSSSKKPLLVRVTTEAASGPPFLGGQACLTHRGQSGILAGPIMSVWCRASQGPINLLVGVSTFTGCQPAGCHSMHLLHLPRQWPNTLKSLNHLKFLNQSAPSRK